MRTYDRREAEETMNRLSASGTPFIFAVSYDGSQTFIEPVGSVSPSECLYSFRGYGNDTKPECTAGIAEWKPEYPSFDSYGRSFDIVKRNIMAGNSYLANLTCRIPVKTDLTMRDIFMAAEAPYKMWIKDAFVCFSPESFIRIADGEISSFPMKGTADATLPHAKETLLADMKEAAEHATIVDLIRNDLSMVAEHVTVRRYRYVETVRTNKGALLQTSSEITGELPCGYEKRMGSTLFALLPAGSITGAPKKETMRIIAEAENFDRGFYTGVMGICADGRLDSAVMIRFIDTEGSRLFFKAGGGITSNSDCKKEYEEVIQKTYVPVY